MTVILGTLAQATAVTILAPSFAIPPASYSLPTMKPKEIQHEQKAHQLYIIILCHMQYYVLHSTCRENWGANQKASPSPAADRLISNQAGDVGITKHTRGCLEHSLNN